MENEKKYSAIQELYNELVTKFRIEDDNDFIIVIHTIIGVLYLVIDKAFKVSKDRIKLITSIKEIINRFVSNLMRRVSEEELNTTEQ